MRSCLERDKFKKIACKFEFLKNKIHFIFFLGERKRISKEILMLKNLKHPNIIHFIGTWINKAKEEVIFITEIVTGGSLKSYEEDYC